MEILSLNNAFEDDRGLIVDLISNDEINAVTLITFNAGSIRANHYHKKTIQWNYIISGEILFVTKRNDGEREERILKKGDYVVTRENESHALKAIEFSEVLIITKGPRAGANYESDTYRLKEPLI